MGSRITRQAYKTLCTTGQQLRDKEQTADTTVSALVGRLNTRSDNDPASADILLTRLEAAKDARDNARLALAQHAARCDTCTLDRSQAQAFADTQSQLGGFSRAPSRVAKPTIPGGSELARMIRDGQTTQGLATVYDRSESTIRKILTDAGFSAVDGKPNHLKAIDNNPEPTRTNRTVFVAQPWAVDALCAQTDPEAFFPEQGGSTRPAKATCAECTVQAECLDWALENGERFGVWGGLSERERRKVQDALDTQSTQHNPQQYPSTGEPA